MKFSDNFINEYEKNVQILKRKFSFFCLVVTIEVYTNKTLSFKNQLKKIRNI
jgi:hypothetical protein